MREQRTHLKSGSALFRFLKENKRSFFVDKTKTGATTYQVSGKQFYIRPKQVSRGFLNRILGFHHATAKSRLFSYQSRLSIEQLKEESEAIRRSLVYKGFCFDPTGIEEFYAIKYDLDSAYWRTAYVAKLVKLKMFRAINKVVLKENRLRLTGTLGKSTTRIEYKKGEKKESYLMRLKKKRIIFQNIYERVKKFVDELMILAYMRNPDNFLGFYVDGFWLKERDEALENKLKGMFNLKTKRVLIRLTKNKGGIYYVHEIDTETGEILPYDAQFKKDFDKYVFLHNFANNKIHKPNFLTRWNPKVMMPPQEAKK
jgi:hypothetical protein